MTTTETPSEVKAGPPAMRYSGGITPPTGKKTRIKNKKTKAPRKAKAPRGTRSGSSPRHLRTAMALKWRSGWYRFGRSQLLRKMVRTAGWNLPAVAGTFASTAQTPALSPLLMDTILHLNGYPLGVDLLTNQALLESALGLYQAGFINSPNEVIIGGLGTAKSSYVKGCLFRSISLGGRGVVFDRKRQQQDGHTARGEYSMLSEEVGGSTIRCHQDRALGTRINILDPNIAQTTAADAVIGQDRLLIMVAEAALDEKLTPEQGHALQMAHKTALTRAATEGRVAVLEDVIDALQRPAEPDIAGVTQERIREWGLPVVLGLLRYVQGDLSGLIDGETEGPNGQIVDFSARLLVFDTSALEFGSVALGIMMGVATAFLMSVWVNVPGPKTVVVEETYSAEGVGAVPALFRDLAKRTRGVGASIKSVFHHLSDVPLDSPLQSLITESEVVCVFRQDKPADAEAVLKLLGLDSSVQEIITTLPRGVHLRKRGGRLPVSIVEMVRTDLERQISFTDHALL